MFATTSGMRRMGLLACGSLLALASGCVSSVQLRDFALTEVVRVVSDLTGQLVAILLQASSPFSAI